MKRQKFELFMCCLGNGITVCNKAVMEHGDYKKIAHISEIGKIKWYVQLESVPWEDNLKIIHAANVQAEKWVKWFTSMPEIKQYDYLLNNTPLTITEFLEIINAEGTITDKIQHLEKLYYEKSIL